MRSLAISGDSGVACLPRGFAIFWRFFGKLNADISSVTSVFGVELHYSMGSGGRA